MSAIDFGLYALYLFIVVAIASAILLPMITLLKNPKTLVKGGVAVLIILAVLFVGYAVSSADVTAKYVSMGVTGQSVKFIGGGLILLYVFIFGSLAAIVLSEISKMFK